MVTSINTMNGNTNKQTFRFIYDQDIKNNEFLYFYCTHIDEVDPWDKSSYYCGFLFSVDNKIFNTRIPKCVYDGIPDQLKRKPQETKYYRFMVNDYGDIVTNVDK